MRNLSSAIAALAALAFGVPHAAAGETAAPELRYMTILGRGGAVVELSVPQYAFLSVGIYWRSSPRVGGPAPLRLPITWMVITKPNPQGATVGGGMPHVIHRDENGTAALWNGNLYGIWLDRTDRLAIGVTPTPAQIAALRNAGKTKLRMEIILTPIPIPGRTEGGNPIEGRYEVQLDRIPLDDPPAPPTTPLPDPQAPKPNGKIRT